MYGNPQIMIGYYRHHFCAARVNIVSSSCYYHFESMIAILHAYFFGFDSSLTLFIFIHDVNRIVHYSWRWWRTQFFFLWPGKHINEFRWKSLEELIYFIIELKSSNSFRSTNLLKKCPCVEVRERVFCFIRQSVIHDSLPANRLPSTHTHSFRYQDHCIRFGLKLLMRNFPIKARTSHRKFMM